MRLSKLTWQSKLFLAVAVLLFLYTLILTVWRLADFLEEDPMAYSDVMMGFVLLVNLFFLLYHAVKGTIFEVHEDLLAFGFVALLLTFYELYQFISKTIIYGFSNLEVIFYARFFGVCLLSPLTIILVVFVYRDLGWREFTLIGSDKEMLRLHRDFTRFTCTLEIDFQLNISLVVCGVIGYFLFERQGDEPLFSLNEAISYIVYAVLSGIWSWVGYFLAKREITKGMYVWLVLAIFQPVYIIYYIVVILVNTEQFHQYEELTLLIVLIGLIALIFRFLLLFMTVKVMKNFDRGLREYGLRQITPNERTRLNADYL